MISRYVLAGMMLAVSASAKSQDLAPAMDTKSYLAQADRLESGAEGARKFLNFAARSLSTEADAAITGPAAEAIKAWYATKMVTCQAMGVPVDLSCHITGLTGTPELHYVGPPEDPQAYAVAFIHYFPDDGNFGERMLAVWHKTPAGYLGGGWTPTGGEEPSDFTFRNGSIRYTARDGIPTAVGNPEDPVAGYRLLVSGNDVDHVQDTAEVSPGEAARPEPGDVPIGISAAEPVRAVYSLPEPDVNKAFGGDGRWIGRYFTPAFAADWKAALKAAGELADMDGDPRTWTQQTDAVRITAIRTSDLKANQGVVHASLDVTVEGLQRTIDVECPVKRIKGKWLIDDIVWQHLSLRKTAEQNMTPPSVPSSRPVTIPRPTQVAVVVDRDMGLLDPAPFVHNGSRVEVYPNDGTIGYSEPKSSLSGTVRPGTVIFRGHIGPDGIQGTAYTYKKGCLPAPYEVRGTGYRDAAVTFILTGAAPMRDPHSCAIRGYTSDSPNAVLRFEPGAGYGE